LHDLVLEPELIWQALIKMGPLAAERLGVDLPSRILAVVAEHMVLRTWSWRDLGEVLVEFAWLVRHD